MPKYWVKNYFAKAKNGGEEERLNDGDNNGQATHGARKRAWRTQAAWDNIWIVRGFVPAIFIQEGK